MKCELELMVRELELMHHAVLNALQVAVFQADELLRENPNEMRLMLVLESVYRAASAMRHGALKILDEH